VAIRATLVASVTVAAVLAAVAIGACSTPKRDFVCAADPECTLGGIQGQCQLDGYCSFPDPGCISGQRYGEYGPDNLAGSCVVDWQPADAGPPPLADARVADADLSAQTIDAHAADAHAAVPDAQVLPPDAQLPDQVMSFAAAIDAWIDSLHPTQNRGADTVLHVSGDPQHALLRFDVSGLPAGAIVTGAEIHLHTTALGGLSAGSIQVFRLLQDWVEGTRNGTDGTVNWNKRSDTADWDTVGAGTGPNPSRSSMVSGELSPAANDSEYAVTIPAALVQGWHRGTTANFGVILVAKNAAGATALFVSSEGTPAPARPSLKVTYKLP
jgi:hypothetical protein